MLYGTLFKMTKATDKFCTICGDKLILVCSRCHTEISDEGIDHKMCARCEAVIKDRNEKIVANVKNVARGVVGVVPVAANKLKGVDLKDANVLGKAAIDIAQKVVKK